MITVTFRFIDHTGLDVTGSEAVQGYHWADYFDGAIQKVVDAETVEQADTLLRAAYKGCDCEGIGVRWDLEAERH